MKTKEEQNALKEKEVETESKEPRKLTEEELAQVSGGLAPGITCKHAFEPPVYFETYYHR